MVATESRHGLYENVPTSEAKKRNLNSLHRPRENLPKRASSAREVGNELGHFSGQLEEIQRQSKSTLEPIEE